MLALTVAAGTAGAESRGTEMALNLHDAVTRALKGNPGLADARMDRMLERYDAKDAQAHFDPQWRIGMSVASYGYSRAERERDVRVSAGERVSMDRALSTHTRYRSVEIAVRRAEIARDLADDATRWDVSPDTQVSFAGAGVGELADRLDSRGDYRVTLNLEPGEPESAGLRLSAGGVDVALPVGER